MPTIPTKIRQAIAARIATLNLAGYEVVWADGPLPDGQQTYTPDPTKAYLRVTWTPNATQRQFIGSSDPHRRPGVLQIDVFGTKVQGTPKAINDAGRVAEHFATDLTMVFQGAKVRVVKAPSVLAPFIDTHVQVPVLVELETLNQ